MQRYNAYGPQDNPLAPVGDFGFVGVNMRLDPSRVPSGYVSEAVNMRFRRGIAETRPGSVVPAWANKVVGTNVFPWTNVYGVGVFRDPDSLFEYVIIAADGGVYMTLPHNAPVAMTLPDGMVIDTPVTFTQAFNVLLMHRGQSKSTLVLDSVSNPWRVVEPPILEDTEEVTGLYAIPNASHSVFFANRLFIPTQDDSVAVSEFGDYTRYFAAADQFRVNQGSSDRLTALYKFNDTTLIAFKERSIYAINNVYGDLEALQQDELTNQFGCLARRSIVHVGRDLWFLSSLGVMSLRQTEQNRLQGVVLPASDAIQPLIERINWKYAANAVAAYYDSKYYLAVPLDAAEVLGIEMAYAVTSNTVGELYLRNLVVGRTYRWVKGAETDYLQHGAAVYTESLDFVATTTDALLQNANYGDSTAMLDSVRQVTAGTNTAILVYDFLNQAWAGYDQTEGRGIQDLYQVSVLGKVRLMAVTHDGFHVMLEEGVEDQLPVPYVDVTVTSVPTNGHTIQVNGGTLVTALGVSNNAGAVWGCNNLAAAQLNLFINVDVSYNQSAVAPWDAPNTLVRPLQVGSGRFYGMNGRVPQVQTTGSWGIIKEVLQQPVQSSMTTRAYTAPDLGLWQQQYLTVDIQTWEPTVWLTANWGGVNETAAVSGEVRKNRRRYVRPAETPDFDCTNVNGDFLVPYREDYSVRFGSDADLGEVSQFYVEAGVGGLVPELHQETREIYRLNGSGKSVQVKLDCTTGRLRVLSTAVQGDARPRGVGTTL